jgi:hypothetical protein
MPLFQWLVLSSRDFAKAYMTDAWATTFFKKILEKYSVVFIGYSANDIHAQMV